MSFRGAPSPAHAHRGRYAQAALFRALAGPDSGRPPRERFRGPALAGSAPARRPGAQSARQRPPRFAMRIASRNPSALDFAPAEYALARAAAL